jgi:hypothetical protein
MGAGPQQTDYGPFPDRYEEVITAALHERLKDPYSIQDLSISPVQYAQLVGLINGGQIRLAFLRHLQFKK